MTDLELKHRTDIILWEKKSENYIKKEEEKKYMAVLSSLGQLVSNII